MTDDTWLRVHEKLFNSVGQVVVEGGRCVLSLIVWFWCFRSEIVG